MARGSALSILSRVRPTRLRVRRVLEALGAPVLYLALRVVKLYRPSFHQTSRWIHRFADDLGVYPVLDHYHEPLVSIATIDKARATVARSIPGLNLRVDDQLRLLAELVKTRDELESLVRDAEAGNGLAPTFDNLAFGPGDAEILYSLLRHLGPRRVVEVGSGHSTRFAMAALDRNRAEGRPAVHLCIEPYESPWLEQLGVDLVRQPVEDVDDELFRSLAPGDVLFIDSSHVVRPQGDVLHLFHEVLPKLPAGVVVHVHDVFTPRDYPVPWLMRRWFWTEQYVLEALLADSPRYEPILALNFLFHDHRAALLAACPVLSNQPQKEPGSFWLRVRSA